MSVLPATYRLEQLLKVVALFYAKVCEKLLFGHDGRSSFKPSIKTFLLCEILGGNHDRFN